jgi:outer membrane protein TolC
MRKIQFLILFFGLGTTGYSQSLDSLEILLLRNNLELQAMQKEVAAAEEAIAAARQNFPNPQVRAGVLVLPTDPMMGMEQVTAGVSQMLPAKGVLKNGVLAAQAQHSAQAQAYHTKQLALLYELRIAYYNLHLRQEQLAYTHQVQKNLSSLQPVAQQAYSAGRSPLSQVLKLEGELLQLEKDIQTQGGEIAAALAAVHTLLGTSADDTLITQIASTFTPPPTDSLAGSHPAVQQWHHRSRGLVYQAQAAASMRNPMLGGGLQYMRMPDGTNGLMPMVMVEVPLWRKRYSAMQNGNSLMAEAAGIQAQQSELALTNELMALRHKGLSLQRQLTLQSEQLKLQTSLREQLQTEFAAGLSSLETLLTEENTYLAMQLEELSIKTELLKTTARLQYVVGE